MHRCARVWFVTQTKATPLIVKHTLTQLTMRQIKDVVRIQCNNANWHDFDDLSLSDTYDFPLSYALVKVQDKFRLFKRFSENKYVLTD